MLAPIKESNSAKLTWTQRHEPISVSVCCNVEGFSEPHCIVEPDVETLVRKMVEYMTRIALRSYELAQQKFSDAFAQLDADINNPMRALLEDDDDDDYKLNAFLDDDELQEENEKEKNVYKKLKEELDAYCRQTIVLGFNSAKYDMNLVKAHLAKQLDMHGPGETFTVKRNNSYACLANETFKMLDVTSYMSPGLSYDKFLKAFDVVENKGFIPYEWFDGVDKLNHPTLPSHEDFYSSLKECNILAEEYQFCQHVWSDYGMSTSQDFRFFQALENLQKIYFDRGIDVFKTSISVPGLARGYSSTQGARQELPSPSSTKPTATSTIPSSGI
jgi:hypothetical protein